MSADVIPEVNSASVPNLSVKELREVQAHHSGDWLDQLPKAKDILEDADLC